MTEKDLYSVEAFEKRAKAALGGVGWQKRLAKAIGSSESTIGRWKQGKVPGYAWAIIELLEALKKDRLPLPKRFWHSPSS